MDWLIQQAQSAGPFVASFCLVICGVLVKVALGLWDQLKFERQEHRASEQAFAEASKEIAVSQVAVAKSVAELTSMLTAVLPTLVNAAIRKDAAE